MPTDAQVSALLATLDAAPHIVRSLVDDAPAGRLAERPAPAKWSIHEHACHLAHVHSLFFDRLELVLREEHPEIHPYLPDRDEPDDLLRRMDLATSLDRYRTDRDRLIQRLRVLGPDDWRRTAEHHEYSSYSVYIMFRHLAMHDHLHAYRIEEILLARH